MLRQIFRASHNVVQLVKCSIDGLYGFCSSLHVPIDPVSLTPCAALCEVLYLSRDLYATSWVEPCCLYDPAYSIGIAAAVYAPFGYPCDAPNMKPCESKFLVIHCRLAWLYSSCTHFRGSVALPIQVLLIIYHILMQTFPYELYTYDAAAICVVQMHGAMMSMFS